MKTMVHWNIFEKKWTVRTYKSCNRCESVLVQNWKTEVKPNRKSNPKGWIYSDHTNVSVNLSEEAKKKLAKKDRLIYNKHSEFFNIKEGQLILCDEEGCFVVEQMPE